MFLGFLYVAVFLDVAYVEMYQCPTALQMQPCSCRNGYVFCESALLDQIRGPLAELGKTERIGYELALQKIQMPNLPSNLLVGTTAFAIKINKCHTSTVDENAFADVAATLVYLCIRGNPLAEVPSQALQKLSKLKELSLDDNEIEVLRARAFEGLISVRSLSLRGNRIIYIHKHAFKGIENTLDLLSLDGNELTAVPGEALGYLTLYILHLQDNKIASLVPEDTDAMRAWYLRILNLANNKIRHLPARVFGSMKSLSSLNLRGNVIESIHPLAFEGNKDFFTPDALSELNLRCNRLEEIPTASLKNLRLLNNIDLRDNNICEVRRDDFSPHGSSLLHIHLQNNSLTYVDPEAFIGLDVLKSLTLQSNQLTVATLQTYSPVLDTLEKFDIHDNPLHCDCDLSWLAKWINGTGSGIVEFANETSCATPEKHTKKLLAEIPPYQLVCGDSKPSLTNAQERLSCDARLAIRLHSFNNCNCTCTD